MALTSISQQSFETAAENTSDSREAVLRFVHDHIDRLTNLEQKHKAWAKQDAINRVQQGADPNELVVKYQFYSDMAQVRNDILSNVSEGKRGPVLQIIEELLDEPTNGNRQIKAEQMQKIKRICEECKDKKSLLRFTLSRYEGEYEQRVFDILNKEGKGTYEKYYKKIFTPNFWKLWEQVNPHDFRHLSSQFMFFSPTDLLGNVTVDEVKTLPSSIVSSMQEDAADLTEYFFSPQERKAALASIKGAKPSNLDDALLTLLSLRQKRIRYEKEARDQVQQIEKAVSQGTFDVAESKSNELEKRFGDGVFQTLGKQGLKSRIMRQNLQLKKLLKMYESTKDPQKRSSISQQIKALSHESLPRSSADDQASPSVQKATLLAEINAKRRQGSIEDLTQARKAAKRLVQIDSAAGKKALEDIQTALDTKQQKEVPKDNKLDNLSEDKKQRIEFIDKCIEHAQRVIEEASQWGVTRNDAGFWSREGCKNRIKWLKEKGLWDTYVKFNSNDPNMPRKNDGMDFRFRWLDLRTGSNLSGAKAQDGIKYLNRYKDSGYPLAVLGGGFSVNWRSFSSPCYDPDRFISICQAEKARIIGE